MPWNMYPESPKKDRWLVYLLGSVVFVGIFYFVLSRFFGVSAGISLAISVPAGVVAFVVFALVAENWESGGWDIRPLISMPQPKRTFALISVSMPGLAVAGCLVAYAVQGAAGLGVLLLSAFGVPIVGCIVAAVSIARHEQPPALSITGLLANAAIPIAFYVLIRTGVGSAWIDL